MSTYEVDRPSALSAFAAPVMLALSAVLVAPAAGAAQAPPDDKPAAGKPSVTMNDAERAFSAKLAGAVLTGRFTTDGQEDQPEPEKYQIVSATKTGARDWLILAKISYSRTDIDVPPVPIPVKVDWAGDTPVLSLTELTIPGFGTFTSRVMFYGDRYAGTWQHNDVGGHLFGTIGKADEKNAAKKDAK